MGRRVFFQPVSLDDPGCPPVAAHRSVPKLELGNQGAERGTAVAMHGTAGGWTCCLLLDDNVPCVKSWANETARAMANGCRMLGCDGGGYVFR